MVPNTDKASATACSLCPSEDTGIFFAHIPVDESYFRGELTSRARGQKDKIQNTNHIVRRKKSASPPKLCHTQLKADLQRLNCWHLMNLGLRTDEALLGPYRGKLEADDIGHLRT